MRAAVPEELDHLDLVAFDGNRLRGLQLGKLGGPLGERDQRRREKQGEE